MLGKLKLINFVSGMLLDAVILSLISLSVFQSVEFYVISAVVAAAVLAFASKGESRGPVRQYLLPGVLSLEGSLRTPSVEFLCNDVGTVILRRHGVDGVSLSGAVSIAVNVKGFDIEIKERVVAGKASDEKIDTASFILDFMATERYFISYRAEDCGLFCATALHNRPGIHVVKAMQ